MDRILPVYKPVGITSFDVIRAFKQELRKDQSPPSREALAGKMGHGGTLDPFADGVLLILLGKATKRMNELSGLSKVYRATAVLGASSDTLDRTGTIEKGTIKMEYGKITIERMKQAATKFVGEIEQEIPDYSAAKIGGVPRYKLARAGQTIGSKSKLVTIHSLKINHYYNSNYGSVVEFETSVSSGTYIRQLSYDLFKSMGIESYLESLTRTAIGKYLIEDCYTLDQLAAGEWIEND